MRWKYWLNEEKGGKNAERLEIENKVSYRTCGFMQFAEFWSDEWAGNYDEY